MCTHDDYDGVYFTIQSILLFHPEVRDDICLLWWMETLIVLMEPRAINW